ncbi:MAG: ABC transporter ATP-binding protein [Bacteroidota bacterium]|nr:ABC transporter ATP-binding protein [Bacteroidota bacterium]
MSEPIITVENLSKSYILKHKNAERYTALRDVISHKTKRLFSGKQDEKHQKSEEFWALKDVAFEIQQGDRVGIIGRNGAGKSTLLKIMSRIVSPTTGKIVINGRVASLLEVGTGFHAELSGRENIFLNGSILGMSKSEITKKFDEIVAFSEVERFLDTPVKRYSSGMYVRLAFAVAAHLDPEILIVDEVLAVGDSVFQKKCIDKMTRIGNEGKTILFVSHNLSAVESLCNKGILISQGRVQKTGTTREIVDLYIDKSNTLSEEIDLSSIPRGGYENEIIFSQIVFNNMPLKFAEKIRISLKLKSLSGKVFNDVDFGLNIMDTHQNCIVHCSNRFLDVHFDHNSDSDTYVFEIENNLKPGKYNLVLFLRTADVIQDILSNEVAFEISDGNPYGFNDTIQIQGSVFPPFTVYKK